MFRLHLDLSVTILRSSQKLFEGSEARKRPSSCPFWVSLDLMCLVEDAEIVDEGMLGSEEAAALLVVVYPWVLQPVSLLLLLVQARFAV